MRATLPRLADKAPLVAGTTWPSCHDAPMPIRYCLAREFPEQPYVPGQTPRPADAPGQTTWDGRASSLGECADYRWGIDLYNHGYYWEAHEAWEQLWRCTEPSPVRELLQGLIQCAGAALKAAMGQPASCRRLIAKALAHLDQVPDRCGGIEVRAFAARMASYDGAPTSTVPSLVLER